MRDEQTYVIGHRNPDSDSIISAIAYSYLLNQGGVLAAPCRLGDINEETQYLLNRFGFERPELMIDARVRLNDIELETPVSLSKETTIFKTLELMHREQRQFLGITDEDGHLEGIITRSDLSVLGMGDTAIGIDLLKETPVELMSETIEGRIIYKSTKTHINGKVSIIALTKSKLEKYEIKDRIVILGDDPQAQVKSIKKGAGLLIVVWADSIDPVVIEIAKQYNCSIIISGLGSMNTSRYLYFSIPIKLIMQKHFVSFKEDELVEDVAIKMRDTTYRTYPVLDHFDALIGYVARYHIMNARNKKIVMVDHNEFAQSVKGIEKAELIEVIDHHRIHNFTTVSPISFRNEIIGSTASIIASMFFERNVEIPENLAGLLLGAMISDALNFQSPTTTPKDLEISQKLAKIANLDTDELAYDMFSVTMNLPLSITQEELSSKIESDMKVFDVNGSKVLIAQVFLLELDSLKRLTEQIQEILASLVVRYDCDLVMVAFTSISENGSIFYGEGPKENLLWEAFKDKNSFHKDILSRKKQIVPIIEKVFSKYS